MSTIRTDDNCIVWGPVIGMNKEYPDLISTRPCSYHTHEPGMLVTCYQGGIERMRARGLDYLGLGIVISVHPHPNPIGEIRKLCTVLWNFEL